MISSKRVFAVSWSDCELDGLTAPSLASLAGGMILRLTERPIPIGEDAGDLARPSVRAKVLRMLETIQGAPAVPFEALEDTLNEDQADITLTDGTATYEISVLQGRRPVLVWGGKSLPVDTDLFLMDRSDKFLRSLNPSRPPLEVICFSPGTLIRTPTGPVDIDQIRPGDLVLTKDSGPQQVEWLGGARITASGLRAHPHLRPVRIKAGALGGNDPEPDLLVSPAHRVLMQGAGARELFGEDEVLVQARDIVNDTNIHVDHGIKEHRYIHMMLPHHAVVWANGLETESFHPGDMSLDDLAPSARDALFGIRPELRRNPFSYGGSARRCLAPAEAAIYLSQRAARLN